MIKKFISSFKEALKKKDGRKHNYHQMKNTYVVYDDGKPKVKLRKHIHSFATNISELNHKGYNVNRQILIEEFEYGGLKAIGDVADSEMEKYIEKYGITR
jgi:hypothetical protein